MIIEIFTVDKFDKESTHITKMFKNYGGRSRIKFSKLYKVVCESSKNYFVKVAKDVLVDHIVERYKIFDDDNFFSFKASVVIDLWFKESVSDICGESVRDAIGDAGFIKPLYVRTAKRFYFLDSNKKALEFIMENYANELIHRIDFKKFLRRDYR